MSNMDHRFDDAVTGRPARARAHPAFPAIVATWFAALFGFGCMLLPGALIDGFADMLNLDALSGNFARPVDFVGRSILAVFACVLGAAGGWGVARGLAATEASPRRPGPRTLDISELDGELPIRQDSEPDAPRKRRRALAIAEDDPQHFYAEAAVQEAPNPAKRRAFDPPRAPVVGVDSDLPDSSAEMDRHPISESADLAAFVQREEPAADQAPWSATQDGDEPAVSRANDTGEAPNLHARKENEAEAVLPAGGASEFPEAPISFSAPSSSRERHAGETPDRGMPASTWNGVNGGERVLVQIENADLASLGTVQLAERLAISIARRRERVAALALQAAQELPARSFPSQASSPPPFDHAATATAFETLPEALRPIHSDFSAEDGEEEDLGLSLPLGAIRNSPGSPLAVRSPRAPVFEDDEEAGPSFAEDVEEDESEDSGGNYGSLLAARRDLDLRGEHIRIDEPEPESDDIEPAVIFPGQQRHHVSSAEVTSTAQPSPRPSRRFDRPASQAEGEEAVENNSAAPASGDRAEAERSLRGALEALQRSSGAA